MYRVLQVGQEIESLYLFSCLPNKQFVKLIIVISDYIYTFNLSDQNYFEFILKF